MVPRKLKAIFLAGGLVLSSCGGSVKYTDGQLTPEWRYLFEVRHNLHVLDQTSDNELIASALRTCQLLDDGFTYEAVTRLADVDRAKLTDTEIHDYETMFKYGIDAFCPQHNN